MILFLRMLHHPWILALFEMVDHTESTLALSVMSNPSTKGELTCASALS